MHDVVIHAWLQEWRRMKSVFKLDSQTTSAEVERTRGFPHGGSSGTNDLQPRLGHHRGKAHQDGGPEKVGEATPGQKLVNLILFAGSYWLVATTPTMLSEMTSEWLRLLGEVGWETPTADLT